MEKTDFRANLQDAVLGSHPTETLEALRQLGLTRAMLRRYFRVDDGKIDAWNEIYGVTFIEQADVFDTPKVLRPYFDIRSKLKRT